MERQNSADARVFLSIILGAFAVIVVACLTVPSRAQVAPQPSVPQNPPLIDQAQQNIGTAQILFKLGQTQGQLAAAQDQLAAKDKQDTDLAAYWKAYVEGVNEMMKNATITSTATPRQ